MSGMGPWKCPLCGDRVVTRFVLAEHMVFFHNWGWYTGLLSVTEPTNAEDMDAYDTVENVKWSQRRVAR